MPITTKVVSSTPAHGKISSIQHYAIKLVSNLRQVGGFVWVLLFPPQIYHSLSAFDVAQSVHAKGGGGGQILNLQNTFDKVCDVSRMEIHTENFFGSLISTRLPPYIQ